MNYESYYENLNEYPEQKPPRRSGRIALLIIVVAVVFFVSGMLLSGLIQSARQPFMMPILPTPEAAQAPNASLTPVPTPLQTERPMVDLDGVAPFLQESGNPIPEIVDAVAPSVVGVVNYAKLPDGSMQEQGLGSGFFISSKGHVLTNAHVIQDASAITVTLFNGKELDAELIAQDDIGDIAVLLVADASIQPLKLGNSDNIRVGEYVVTMGNPIGRLYEGTVTMGIISAKSRAITIDSSTNIYIQTDAAINVGNSGGPLLNMSGEVIGINTAKTVNAGYDAYGMSINAEGLGFALPINRVQDIVQQLITKGFVEYAALGVNVQSLSKQEATSLGLDYGITVVSVVRGGPADLAGLLPGDIILFYDGIRAERQDALVEYVRSSPVGSTIDLVVWRDGQEGELTVDLGNMQGLDYGNVEIME